MSDTSSQTHWNDLVDDLVDVEFGRVKDVPLEDMSETSSEASVHSQTSQYQITKRERKTVRNLDHRRCFVTNIYSHGGEIARIIDNCNVGTRKMVDALRGIGIVHEKFNFADISNLIFMSRELHYLWDKHATFVIVPSQNTRSRMIEILEEDRERILGAEKSKLVEPRQLAYPEAITYDIILFQPSLFGSPRWSFQRADNHEEEPACYTIPERSGNVRSRPEYLIKQADGARVSEFLNIRHVTARSENQAINPYLMVMNAIGKLQYWRERHIRSEDPVFTTALAECRRIIIRIYARSGVTLRMRKVQPNGDAKGDERGGRPQDVTITSGANGALPELLFMASSAHLNHDSSTWPRTRSWISRGGSDKARSMETWRREVGELSDVV